ncbi:YpdA family putative bacillithiol disulfide reductase [Marinicrinis lubricantis]|uniref:YpdA family putative bacillithiol disulfide reductase n=1 Tax=Marinicrinis lubricantis TaxID=2086470 RepID=A0ABW1ITN2_9BACL
MEQVIIIGGGPCGLSAAVECKRAGLDPLIIEKGSLVHSIYLYPTYLVFHSTPELLEIGGIPFTTPNEKPTRLEALTYYRMVAEREQLRVHTYETVVQVEGTKGAFSVHTENRFGEKQTYTAKHIVIATGYFDRPNYMDVPGENLPKVSHFYQEAHPYSGMKVAIIGGKNSAVDAALDLVRVGAEVTVIYRKSELSPSVKPWMRPLFESAAAKGRIRVLWNSQVKEITERSVIVDHEGIVETLDNDFVLALTGFRPDRSFLGKLGVHLDEENGAPEHHPETMETNVPGLYIAGVIAAGGEANAIFIENGRWHGKAIADHIRQQSE